MTKTTMLRLARRVHRVRTSTDSGFAMIIVLGMATVMTLLIGGGLLYASQGTLDGSANDRYSALAYNAAVAGVNDYVARLNNNPSYCTTNDPTNAALTGWQRLPGTSGEAYRYQVVSDCSIATGDSSNVYLKVSGIAGPTTGPSEPVVRTITAEIKRAGFRDYVFFTDKEEGDPTLPEYGLTTAQQTACEVYNFSATAIGTRPSYCINLGFGTGDVLNGKVHTNDVIDINGNADFTSAITEGCPGATSTQPCYSQTYQNSGGTPTFGGGQPQTGVTLPFPSSDASVQTAAAAGGCVYYGATRIVLLPTGNMSIASPESTSTTACPLGTNVPMPANGVIYVANATSANANYTATCGAAPWVTDPTTGAADSGGTSYPLANDSDVANGYISCQQGNLWIEGTLKGIADIGAQNNLYITGDITYLNGLTGASATDGLGLVANNQLEFYHPIGVVTTPAHCSRSYNSNTGETQTQCTGTKRNNSGATCTGTSNGCAYGTWVAATSVTQELCPSPCGQNLTVDAALLSISHSIRLPYFNQSYTRDMGTLTINGSLAQYYRGPVRTGSPGAYQGYTKSYNYDPRLINITLPGFPAITSTYGTNGFTANPPAYGAPCFGGWRAKGSGC